LKKAKDRQFHGLAQPSARVCVQLEDQGPCLLCSNGALSPCQARPDRAGRLQQLSLPGSAARFGATVTTRKLFYSTSRIDKFLFPCEKRMASGADADFNVLTCGACVINRAARTDDIGLVILRMYARFHGRERTRNLRVARRFRKR
jgi:hypothetical protein